MTAPSRARAAGSLQPELLDCAVIIVNYNAEQDLDRLLTSIPAAANGLRLDVVVVDNASARDPQDVIARHSFARLVRAPANLGYSGGINLGLRHILSSATVLIANPDVTFDPGALSRLVETARAAGAAVPLILDGDGRRTNSLRREPTLLRAFGDAVAGDRFTRRPSWSSETVYSAEDYDHVHAVEWATGAVLATDRALADSIGWWDEDRFFLYSEETDYCRRLRDAGAQVMFDPDAVVRHREGGSGREDSLVALLAVNRVRYYRKYHASGPDTLCFAAAVGLRHLLRVHRRGDRLALRALLSGPARRRLPGRGT